MDEITHFDLDGFILKNEKKRYVINSKKNWYSINEDFIKIYGFYSRKCDTFTIETPRGEFDLVVEFCTHCGPDEFGTVLTVLDSSHNLLKAFNN